MFAHTAVSRNTKTQQIDINTKYYTFCVAENKTRQGRGPLCTGKGCKQPTYTRVIDQERFINKEIMSCKFCGTVNEITATSPSLRDSAQVRRVGEWITMNRHEQIRREKEKENLEKFNKTHNPKPKNNPVTTQNRFDALTNLENADMLVDSIDDDKASISRGTIGDSSAASVISLRKRAIPHQRIQYEKRGKNETGYIKNITMSQPQQNNDKDLNSNEPPIQPRGGQRNKKAPQHEKTSHHIKKLPPIVCTHEGWVESTNAFKKITEIAKDHNCDLKTDKRSGKLMFTPRSLENRISLREDLQSRPDFEFHTFGTKLERRPSKKVVAKGVITSGHTEDEIIHDIKERYGMIPERAVPLRNSALLLIFCGETDMRDIKNITTILYQKVKIEKYKVKLTAVTQCKRCLNFGHVQAHCGRRQVNDVETETDIEGKHIETCSKCHQPGHTARQAKCPLFQEEIKRQRERRLRFHQANEKKEKSNKNQNQDQEPTSGRAKPEKSYAHVAFNKPTSGHEEIIEKMFAMFQTMQQQLMNQMQQQMQQIIQLIRNG